MNIHQQLKLNLLTAISLLALTVPGHAHAFLDHAEPAVGSSAKEFPKEIKITFTEELEVAFSSIKVFDVSGKQVDGKDVHADPKNPRILVVSLPESPAEGTYKVVWRVVSKDAHVTHGDFAITRGP